MTHNIVSAKNYFTVINWRNEKGRCPEGYASYTSEGGFSMHLGVRGSSEVFEGQEVSGYQKQGIVKNKVGFHGESLTARLRTQPRCRRCFRRDQGFWSTQHRKSLCWEGPWVAFIETSFWFLCLFLARRKDLFRKSVTFDLDTVVSREDKTWDQGEQRQVRQEIPSLAFSSVNFQSSFQVNPPTSELYINTLKWK